MRKKALNVILFLAVVIAAVGMTLYVGRGAASIPGLQLLLSGNYGDRLCGGNVRRNVPHE